MIADITSNSFVSRAFYTLLQLMTSGDDSAKYTSQLNV